MKNRLLSIAISITLCALLLSSCNLPDRQYISSPTSFVTIPTTQQGTSTPMPVCANPYFPNTVGDKWEYSGTNSLIGAYNRTDTITSASDMSFTQDTTLAGIAYSVPYECSSAGLTSTNPVQQYAGALLSNANLPVSVNLSSNSGTSLPARIAPGDSWQQTADFDAVSQQLSVSGRFVFEYSAVGYENISVPAGTYETLHVNCTIRIEVTGLHILAGTYTSTYWYAPQVGVVKSEGTSHITGVNFTDSMQLTSYTQAP